MNSKSLGTISAAQTLHRCPNCSCPNTVEAKLTHEAQSRIAQHNRPLQSQQLDPTVFIVEDEYGRVRISEGDLSFMITSAPVLDKLLAPQLNADIREHYKEMQSDVWDMERLEECAPLNVNGRDVVIMPGYVDGGRYTITAFSMIKQKDKVAA